MGSRAESGRRKGRSLEKARRKKCGRESPKASGGLRVARARKVKIPQLRADRFSVRAHGRPCREALFNAGPSRRSSRASRLNGGAESLAFECRSRAWHVTRRPRSKDLLHHACHSGAAHLRAFYESVEASPLQLSAIP